ncbi:MAG: tetratricopeptide repeat protein [Patescibacteria group bacterium]
MSIILIPFSILLLDLIRRDFRFRKGSVEFMPFGIAAVFFGIIAMFGKTLQLKELTLMEQFLLSCKGLGFYLWKFFAPTGLTVYQPQFSPVTIAAPESIIAIVMVLALIVAAWTVRKRFPLFTFGLALYVLSVAPSFMNFWKKGTLYFASDRYAYIGIIGIALAAVTIVLPLLDRISTRMRAIIGTILLVIMTGTSFAQAMTWSDSAALYTRALKLHPDFSVAMNNLGAAQYQNGKKEEALATYERARATDPTLTSASVNIALYWRKEGDPQRAMEAIQAGLQAIPEGRPAFDEEIKAWNILGLLYDERGMHEEALTAYRKAVERAPESADAHYNLGVTAQKYGLLPEAREHLALYLALKPRDLEARYRLAAVQAETGMLPDAVKNLRIILYEDPEYQNAEEHLERIMKMMEQ